jgi:cytochrome b561
MGGAKRIAVIVLGALSAVMIVAQFVMGLLMYRFPKMIEAHKHSGHMTVVVVLVYVFLSLSAILTTPAAASKREA